MRSIRRRSSGVVAAEAAGDIEGVRGTAESEARRQFAAVQERMIGDAAVEVRPRFVELESGLRLQLLEAGEGDPLVVLPGTGAPAVVMLPLVEHLRGQHVLIVDRPGHGLSDPVEGYRERPRTTAVDVVVGLLDALGLDRVDLVGSSGGAIWTLWAALDRPQRVRRVVLLGAVPLLLGTRTPLPLRLMATPVIGSILDRVMPDPSPDMVKRLMGMMGEGDTIVRYPAMIDALVATNKDPIAGDTIRQEHTAVIRGVLGWRPSARFTKAGLGQMRQPTLLIWGDHDPVGSPDAARSNADVIPNAQAVVVHAGHAPWFGEPERIAELITRFLNETA